MTQQSFNISSRYLSVNGELVLKAMISLTKLSPSVRWEYTGESDSDIVIIDTDREEGRRMWMDLSNSGCQQTLIAYTAKADRFPEGALVLTKPLRSSELVPLLEKITREKLAQRGEHTTTVEQQQDITTDALLPSDAFVDPISRDDTEAIALATGQRALDIVLEREKTPIRIINSEHTVIIERSRRQYFGEENVNTVKELLLAENRSVQIEEIDMDRFAEYTVGLTAHELDIPLWEAVLDSSCGQLISGLSTNQTYRLRRWPDFKKLEHKPIHVRLTVFLSKRGGDINALARLSGIPVERVIDFVNACHALHYLEIQKEAVASPPPQNSANKSKLSLFGRIRARLGI